MQYTPPLAQLLVNVASLNTGVAVKWMPGQDVSMSRCWWPGQSPPMTNGSRKKFEVMEIFLDKQNE